MDAFIPTGSAQEERASFHLFYTDSETSVTSHLMLMASLV